VVAKDDSDGVTGEVDLTARLSPAAVEYLAFLARETRKTPERLVSDILDGVASMQAELSAPEQTPDMRFVRNLWAAFLTRLTGLSLLEQVKQIFPPRAKRRRP